MITIIGSGKVGGDAALFSALKRLDDQILLLDVVDGLPQGEAMDINHMLSEQGIDVEVKGSNNFADMKGSNIVVVVAGSGRKPGMTRMDLLKINATVVKSVVENIKKYANDSMIISVTNPLDPMTYVTYKVSGFDRSRVFGMGGMLDLSRFRQFIHEATGHSRDSIRALVIGEHGENMLPLPRFSSVSGIPLSSLLSKQKLDEIVQNTKQVAAKVIELKGATVHAPGNAISTMIESVVRNRKQVIPVATYLDGEYGHSDVTIGVPAVIGKNGVEKIIELELNAEERQV
ncbi:MAG: malate dehydrogenase, partial [Nitrosarchaeum sp.]|nr:malate dehydrogenase [Nitrosarchaeum sp.]